MILANIILLIVLLGILGMFFYFGYIFALGFIFATGLFQLSYRLRHGQWFDIEWIDQ